MNSEVADTQLKVSEQSSPTSSPIEHPPIRRPETSSTGHQVPEDTTTPDETQRLSPVNTVDAAAADLLSSAVEDGPGEDWSLAEQKAGQAQDDNLGLLLLESERKTGDLRRRSKQAVLHLTFTEIRIAQMEQQIRNLEAELHDKADDFQVSVVRRQAPTYKSFIKRSSDGEFLLTRRSLEIAPHKQASLEVLVTDHGTPAMLEHGHSTASPPASIRQRTHQQTPERLRIRYGPLIKSLEKISSEQLSNHNFWPDDRLYSGKQKPSAPTILLRPWKFFIAHEKEIRDSIHNVDAFIEPA